MWMLWNVKHRTCGDVSRKRKEPDYPVSASIVPKLFRATLFNMTPAERLAHLPSPNSSLTPTPLLPSFIQLTPGSLNVIEFLSGLVSRSNQREYQIVLSSLSQFAKGNHSINTFPRASAVSVSLLYTFAYSSRHKCSLLPNSSPLLAAVA